MASEQLDAPDPRTWHRGCGVRVTLILTGVVLGFAAEVHTQVVIEHAWSYCVGLPWVPAYEEAPDSFRFDLFGWPLYLLAYISSFPLGFFLTGRVAGRLARRRSPSVRVAIGCLIGLLALGTASVGDLVLNVAAPHGYSVSARCPAGHPPWWPGWLPTSH